MPRTNFGSGTPITAEFLNAVAYPKMTGLAQDGHGELIRNENLDQNPGSLVFDFYDKNNRLRSSRDVTGGLNLRVERANILTSTGQVITVASQVVALPDNQVSFVSLDNAGAIQVTSFNPPSGIRSARVTTGSGQITDITDNRYDYLWMPNVNALAVFGGNSTVDYTAPQGITVLSGVLNCRDFNVPFGAIIEVDRTLTVRASGRVTIRGTVRTRVNPIVFGAFTQPFLGLVTGAMPFINGQNSTNPIGVPVQNRAKANDYRGFAFCDLSASTIAANQAVFVQYDVTANKYNPTSGTSGMVFSVHAAAPIVIGSGSVISASASNTGTAVIDPSLHSASSHPISGLFTTNWQTRVFLTPPQASAGTIVIQSSTRIDVETGATIQCRGCNSTRGRFEQFTQAAYSNGFWSSVGAGGGGAIHFQAPIVNSSPSATIDANPGLTGTLQTPVLDGVGSSGNGYIHATATPAQPGIISTSIAAPVEF